MATSRTVGFIGIGIMGRGMAMNLLKSGTGSFLVLSIFARVATKFVPGVLASATPISDLRNPITRTQYKHASYEVARACIATIFSATVL